MPRLVLLAPLAAILAVALAVGGCGGGGTSKAKTGDTRPVRPPPPAAAPRLAKARYRQELTATGVGFARAGAAFVVSVRRALRAHDRHGLLQALAVLRNRIGKTSRRVAALRAPAAIAGENARLARGYRLLARDINLARRALRRGEKRRLARVQAALQRGTLPSIRTIRSSLAAIQAQLAS